MGPLLQYIFWDSGRNRAERLCKTDILNQGRGAMVKIFPLSMASERNKIHWKDILKKRWQWLVSIVWCDG